MDAALHQRIYEFLGGREGKKDSTLDGMMRTMRLMESEGFRFDVFLASEAQAQQEGDRFLLWRRTAPPATRGRRPKGDRRGGAKNVITCIKALARMQRYKDAEWRLPKPSQVPPDCYRVDELGRLLRLPYGRSEASALERAVVEAHLALGWRVSEHANLEDTDLHPATNSVFLRNPAKGNPQRELPVEPEFFLGMAGRPGARGPLAAWLRSRPVYGRNPHLVWVYTDPHTGVVRAMTPAMFAATLAEAGRKAGVRANCTRGRHTRCAALLAQGKQLAFVRFFMGHAGIATLTAYIEQVSLGLLNHLKRTSWFVSPPPKPKEA